MIRDLARPLILAALTAAALPASASAGATVTGSDGRDEVTISGVNSRAAVVHGASSVTGDGCIPLNDTIINRPTAFSCPAGGSWSISLGGADDVLAFDVRNVDDAIGSSMTADGGAGADNLAAEWPHPRTLRGGDGDDTLAGLRAASQITSERGVVFEGGAGRDQVDYADMVGVTASLASGSATARSVVPRDLATGQFTGRIQSRDDTLTAIERLAGSPEPDSLTGGPGADELLGQGGADNISGGAGDDIVDGGADVDQLDGGDGADSINGGPGRDRFAKGSGGDTITSRDAFAEEIACVKDDVVVSDLVDKLGNPESCKSVSVAAAKHSFDTQLLGVRGSSARIACPAEKTEPCAGVLRLRVGTARGRVLARARYRLRQGKRATLAFRLPPSRAALLGRIVTLQAAETDGDRRPRSVVRTLRATR